MITKLEIYGIMVLVVLAACVGAYFYGRHDGTTIERAKWEAESLKAAKQNMDDLKTAINTSNGISQRTLDAVANIKVVNRTITNQVQREITTDVRYAADCFPDTGRLLWNSINLGVLPSSPTVAKPPATVPVPARPARR